jgi:hypothetical protein
MAVGVYKRPKKPKGPFSRENIMNRKKPRATVGMPINELNIVLIRNLPLKFERPRSIAIGIPQRAAIKVAEPETNNDLNVISVILGSPEKMSWRAFNRPSNRFNGCFRPSYRVRDIEGPGILVGILCR